jgi:hypothetical protein
VAEAFTQERITASHANLIARLPQESQAETFEQCWRKDWQDSEPHLLPAKHVSATEHASKNARRNGCKVSLAPHRGPRLSNLSLERFRTSIKYQDRPAAADIAFCVAAHASGMTEDRIERSLEDDYLSRDPSASKRAAYIRRTIEKAKRWVER